jgi:hypothetical protein
MANSVRKDRERSTKHLLPIIGHYRTNATSDTGSATDISAHLMFSDPFMRVVWKNERLSEAFYAPYLLRKPEDYRLELFFGAPDPCDLSYENDNRFKLLSQRQTGPSTLDHMQDGILPKYTPRSSHRLRRELLIAATILWFNIAKAKSPEQYEFMSVDDTSLDFSMIYTNTKLPIGGRRRSGRREVSFIAQSAFLLSESEIKNLISTIKQLFPDEEDQMHLDQALQRLVSKVLPCSHVPRALEDDMFAVLSDPEKSSIHRHFLSQGMERKAYFDLN